ncbi:hypothetical protein BDQ17DRAFT_1261245 [Cyathus striatus]|nr:hypothetical protein BDQ17DRAFT_1261245 [Cyathus striatus]
MSTKALNRLMPYQALNNKAPNLADLPLWECCVWVHDADGGKVHTRARLGHWVGFDLHSKGHRIYWPDKKLIGIEHMIYFMEDQVPVDNEQVELVGEDSGVSDEPNIGGESITAEESGGGEVSSIQNIPSNSSLPKIDTRPMCNRKPSQYVCDIQARMGMTTI